MRLDRVELVAELKRRDMTQKQLAEASGVSRATINYIISGKGCSEEVGHKLADALGVDMCKLTEQRR